VFNEGWLSAELARRPRIETYITLLESYGLMKAAEGKRRVIEVGSQWGYSTILLAQQGCTVYAVDPHQDFHSAAMWAANVRRYGMASRVASVEHFSQEALPQFTDAGFDLMFIDGDHSEEVASHDCRHALRLVKPGGIIAVHDYTMRWPGVLAAVRRELRCLPDHWLIQSLYLAVR
jgi:predicted O-methyltransferase YrrM